MLRAEKEVVKENLLKMVVKQMHDLFNISPSVGSLHNVRID